MVLINGVPTPVALDRAAAIDAGHVLVDVAVGALPAKPRPFESSAPRAKDRASQIDFLRELSRSRRAPTAASSCADTSDTATAGVNAIPDFLADFDQMPGASLAVDTVETDRVEPVAIVEPDTTEVFESAMAAVPEGTVPTWGFSPVSSVEIPSFLDQPIDAEWTSVGLDTPTVVPDQQRNEPTVEQASSLVGPDNWFEWPESAEESAGTTTRTAVDAPQIPEAGEAGETTETDDTFDFFGAVDTVDTVDTAEIPETLHPVEVVEVVPVVAAVQVPVLATELATRPPVVAADAPIVVHCDNLVASQLAGGRRVAVLQGINLTARAGEFVVITGRSGSGKSTLLESLAGLHRIDSGEAFVDGIALTQASEAEIAELRSTRIGFVHQDLELIDDLSTVENVEIPLLLNGWDPGEARTEAEAALSLVGLERGSHRPTELSGGERRRAAIARALVGEPTVLWADEPTGGVDPETAAGIFELLFELCHDGMTVIAATHDPTLLQCATARYHLRDGRLEAS